MADRHFNQSSSFVYGSDSVLTFKCEPCGSRGNTEEAVGLCKVCDELLCTNCLTVHRSSKALKGHKIQHDLHNIVRSQHPTHSSQYCDIHKDSQVEFFCSTHDDVFCRLCRKLEHRNCQSVETIADVCSGSAQQYQNYFSEISVLVKQFKDLKSQRETNIEKLQKQGKKCQDDVRKLRAEINKLFDRLETDINDKISNAVENEKGNMSDQISNIDSAIDSLESRAKNLTEANTRGSDHDVFICMKKVALEKMETVLDDMQEEVSHVKLKFEVDVSLKKILDTLQSLGQLKVDILTRGDHSRGTDFQVPGIKEAAQSTHQQPGKNIHMACQVPYEIRSRKKESSVSKQPQRKLGGEFKGQQNVIPGDYKDRKIVKIREVNVKDNDSDCWITGCTVLPSGEVIMCDYPNNKLKMTDTSITTLHSSITLNSRPWDVAVINPTQAVVTLPDVKKLQFVTVKPQLSLDRTVDLKRKCWGVDVWNGMILVGCQNGQNGDVLVLNQKGEMQRTLRVFDVERSPNDLSYYIAISNTGEHLFVSRSDTDTITCHKMEDGSKVKTYREGLSCPCGILVDTADNLYVCNRGNNSIQIVNKNDSSYKTLLSQSGGILYPFSICYRESDRTLLVVGYCFELLVIKFK